MIRQALVLAGLTAVLSILLVELALRLPFAAVVVRVRKTMARALRVLRARSVSDHWKQKAMLAYAGSMFACSMKLAGLLLVIAAAATAMVLVFNQLEASFGGFVVGGPGIALTIILASLYLAVRRFLFPAPGPLSRSVASSARHARRPARRARRS